MESHAKFLHDKFFPLSVKFKKHFFDGILVSIDRSWCPGPCLLRFVPIQLFSTEIFAFKVSSFLAKTPHCQCVRVNNFYAS